MMMITGILLGCLAAVTAAPNQFGEKFQFNVTDIAWPSDEIKTQVFDKNEYIPVNNAIAGIKVWKGMMYLTVPRWKPGVPVTLGFIPAELIMRDIPPKLHAYPNWDMQTVGDCRAFQFVQSMEIDPKGRMWVLDTGRTETMTTEPKARCNPRLVILDLENNGAVLRSIPFPESVTPHNESYLNDIVLDSTDGGFAYISDTNDRDPGIIVFSLEKNRSWKVRHDSMKKQKEAEDFFIGEQRVIKGIPIDGIALSQLDANERFLYYCPLSSYHLYSVSTAGLKDEDISNIDPYIRDVGRKSSQTDGMIMSANGTLYFGLLADDAVALWDSQRDLSFTTGQRIIARDHVRMQWPDSFAIDDKGYLWCTTNALHNFMHNKIDPRQVNYRIVRAYIENLSYQYHENGTTPELPIIIAGAGDRLPMAIGTFIFFILAIALQ
ncbi:protein yellow [Fopius arisanus]|uniref:Protein yellow n=1 Tax=Fopius arisanus TaxID=64838 RepID=A0A0C9QZK4_9HYME|nr:PREDICTED: protein yellow-like [Fopius arisanus]